MIKIQGQYTLEDLKSAQKLHQGSGGSPGVAGYMLMAVGILMVLTTIGSSMMGQLNWTLSLVPAALLAAFGFYLVYWGPRQMARIFQQQKDLSAPFEMELSEDGFGMTNIYGRYRVPWKDFAKWKEDQVIVVLYRSDVMLNFIPKRLLAGADQLQYLHDLLAQGNVVDARQVQKRKWIWRALIYVLLFIAICTMVYFNIRQAP